jgi:hypothetical protein
MGWFLRECSFLAVQKVVQLARSALGLGADFRDDTLGYFTERLDPAPTRLALAHTVRVAKRNKAFAHSPLIGLAIDGTKAGYSRKQRCSLCRPVYHPTTREVIGYGHHLVLGSVVGVGLPLPVDVEPYGPGDSEYAAGQRLLVRVVRNLGKRFADYVVVDGEYATAPFVHLAGDLGLYVVAALKDNLPELREAAEHRFAQQPPHETFWDGEDFVEVWDALDWNPWTALRWERVRVLRYLQHKPDGKVNEGYWLTDFPKWLVHSRTLYRIAKGRWEIENQGFNDAKNRYGLGHICHHHANSLLIDWLITILVLTVERLYRLRYLHRNRLYAQVPILYVTCGWAWRGMWSLTPAEPCGDYSIQPRLARVAGGVQQE